MSDPQGERRQPEHPPEVIDACRRGDRDALGTVLRAHCPAMERLLGRLIGPDADLEDLVQTTLMAVVDAFPRFRGEASVRTWMTRIAINVARQHLRRPERRRRAPLELVPEDRADGAPAPDRIVGERQRLDALYRHLDAINGKQRIAFVLHVIEGHPIDEVAALTGASQAATKSRIFWARRALMSRARRDPALRDLATPGRGTA